MKKLLLFSIILMFISNTSYSQVILRGEEDTNINDYKIDLQKLNSQYAGNYHFGFSEGESNLEIKMKGTIVTAKLTYGLFSEKSGEWIKKSIILKNIKIIGNIFVADGWFGIFVTYKTEGLSRLKGLIVFKSTHWIKNEYGSKMSY